MATHPQIDWSEFEFPSFSGFKRLHVDVPCRSSDKYMLYRWDKPIKVPPEIFGRSINSLCADDPSWMKFRFYRPSIINEYHATPVPLP